MVRRVREGFGDERGGRGRGSAARGNLRLDELTAADRSSRKEARRLGLLNRWVAYVAEERACACAYIESDLKWDPFWGRVVFLVADLCVRMKRIC